MATDYGYHPTSLSNLSDGELYSMYRGESWFNMNENARLELLQETVNRSAMQKGEVGSCKVSFDEKMDIYTSGAQAGNEIRLNHSMFVNDVSYVEYGDRVFTNHNEHSNMDALMTVLHEDIHAWQNQCIDGTIDPNNSALMREYLANNFDTAVITTADGKVAIGQQYLSGLSENGGYYMYFLQSTERDAHLYSEKQATQIMSYLESKYGNEPSFQAFKDELAQNGYEATLARAQIYFDNPNIEKDINTVLTNQFYQTNEPVSSPQLEEAVKQEMIDSFEESLRSNLNPELAESATAVQAGTVANGVTVNTEGVDNTEGVTDTDGAAQNTGITQDDTLSNDNNGIQGEEGGIDEGGIDESGIDEGGIGGDDDGGIE